MLLELENIKYATELSVAAIELAFARNGYPDEKFVTADFIGMTPTGSFVYQCTYPDMDTGGSCNARTYLNYNKDGILVGDY